MRCHAGSLLISLAVGLAMAPAAASDLADQELNRVYAQLRASLKHDAESEQSLVQAQRAWLIWRDKEANLCAQAQGWSPAGTGYSQVESKCRARLTAERVSQLKAVLRDVLKLQ